MISMKKIVLQPKMENEHRQIVSDWFSKYCNKDSWCINSKYTTHGTFVITVTGKENERAVTMFVLMHPDTNILESEYETVWEAEPQFNELFEVEA